MTSGFYALDANDTRFPEMLHGEVTDFKMAIDYVRHWVDPNGAQIKLLKTGTLKARIDKHHPIWCLYQVTQGQTKIRLLLVDVNWGRGVDAAVFKQAVLDVMKLVNGVDHVVLCIQELDEADQAKEHPALMAVLEPKTRTVNWSGREVLCLSPGFTVTRKKVVTTMAEGLHLNPPAPKGTGPERKSVTCHAQVGDIELFFGTTHPHRDLQLKTVQQAREVGARIFRHQLLEQSLH